MEKQQLVHKGKDMTDVDRKVREIKETLDKIWKDPKAMKEIDQLIADHSLYSIISIFFSNPQ